MTAVPDILVDVGLGVVHGRVELDGEHPPGSNGVNKARGATLRRDAETREWVAAWIFGPEGGVCSARDVGEITQLGGL